MDPSHGSRTPGEKKRSHEGADTSEDKDNSHDNTQTPSRKRRVLFSQSMVTNELLNIQADVDAGVSSGDDSVGPFSPLNGSQRPIPSPVAPVVRLPGIARINNGKENNEKEESVVENGEKEDAEVASTSNNEETEDKEKDDEQTKDA